MQTMHEKLLADICVTVSAQEASDLYVSKCKDSCVSQMHSEFCPAYRSCFPKGG